MREMSRKSSCKMSRAMSRESSIAIRVGALQLMLVALAAGSQGLANDRIAIGNEGWYGWRVAAHGGHREWCCGQWNMGRSTQTGCDLDSGGKNLLIMDSDEYQAGEMQLYALLDAGRPTNVRVLSPQCTVTADRPISDLGLVRTEVSLDWLQKHVDPASGISSDVLAAISVHEGIRARDALIEIARNGATIEHRTDAIQWLGLSRIDEARDAIRQMVYEERNSDVQEEALLALSQLPPDEAARELIAIIERPGLDMEIRRMALFSLAQTDSDLVLSYISALLAGD
jgi:hypothetical protein